MLHVLDVRRTALAVGVVTLLLVGGSGCGGDPQPVIAAPSPTPATSSAAPTPVAETPPADETPEEFIRRWFATSTAMQNSGDSSTYRSLTAGCRSCTKLADRVDQYYAAGGSVSLTRQVVTRTALRGSDGVISSYLVVVRSGPTAYKTSAAAEETALDGGRTEYEVRVRRGDAGWQVDQYSVFTS